MNFMRILNGQVIPPRTSAADVRNLAPDPLHKFFKFQYRPVYGGFANPSTRHAQFERTRFWKDTGEHVGVYFLDVHVVGQPLNAWKERFVIAIRNGKPVEIRRFGVRTHRPWLG